MEAPFKQGNVSESVVLTHYLRAGFIVSAPFGVGASYDFVIDPGSSLFRAQVKTGRLRNGVVEFETRRTRGRRTRSRYKENEADYFVICCTQLETVYAMKAREGVFGKLRVRPTGNNQQVLVKWAEDYSFEKHVAALKAVEARHEFSA
jgi:hypothetical protein